MEVHILEPEPGHIEDEAGFVIRSLDQDPKALDVVQNVRLHTLRGLGIRVMQPDSNDVYWSLCFVSTPDVALPRSILLHEALVVGGKGLLQRHALPMEDELAVDFPFAAPIDGRDHHDDALLDVPLAGPEKSQDQTVGVLGSDRGPEDLLETLGCLVSEMLPEYITPIRYRAKFVGVEIFEAT